MRYRSRCLEMWVHIGIAWAILYVSVEERVRVLKRLEHCSKCGLSMVMRGNCVDRRIMGMKSTAFTFSLLLTLLLDALGLVGARLYRSVELFYFFRTVATQLSFIASIRFETFSYTKSSNFLNSFLFWGKDAARASTHFFNASQSPSLSISRASL